MSRQLLAVSRRRFLQSTTLGAAARCRCHDGHVNAGTRPSTILDADETIDAYAAAADRFATSVLWSDLRAPVASCPGWSRCRLRAVPRSSAPFTPLGC